jgi:hypothetical protein
MRSAVSTDWPNFLSSDVEALNEMSQKKLGNFFSPPEINNKLDDTKVHNAQKKNILQCMRSLIGKSKNPFQIGRDVYIAKRIEVFDKSFFSHVSNSFFLYSLMQTSQV